MEFRVFLEMHQGSETSFMLLRNLRVPLGATKESGLYLELRGTWCPADLQQEMQGSSRVAMGEAGFHLRCEGKILIPLKLKEGNWPSFQDEGGGTRGPFHVLLKEAGLLSSCKGYTEESLEFHKRESSLL